MNYIYFDNSIKDFTSYYIMNNIVMTDQEESPRSKIKKYSEKVPKSNKRRRISDNEFEILKPGEEDQLSSNNYRVQQLKDMCRYYKQRVGGNKDELTKRIYNYLRLSFYALKIQKLSRKYLFKKYVLARGPAFIKRGLCVNDNDFFTMEPVKDISNEQFISYKCKDSKIYGFDIMSLYNLIRKGSAPFTNPYNRIELPRSLLNAGNYLLQVGNIYGDKIITKIEEEEIDSSKELELRVLAAFQKINSLGNYVDHTWLWSLQRIQLIRFVRELADIWQYRAELANEVKRQIFPPHGDIFRGLNLYMLPVSDRDQLRTLAVTVIERLINGGVDYGSQSLGANYALCALTLVSQPARDALPWLYQSVSQH